MTLETDLDLDRIGISLLCRYNSSQKLVKVFFMNLPRMRELAAKKIDKSMSKL
jgi:hypothetical protein